MAMKMNRVATIILSMVAPALSVLIAAQATAAPAKFGSKWQALMGEWKGENASGDSAGACGFHLDLDDHVIVRTNHAVLAPAGGDAVRTHDDLMIIYPAALE